MTKTHFGLKEIASHVGATLVPSSASSHKISGIATLTQAKATDLSFFHNPRYRSELRATQAGAVILAQKDVDDCTVPALVVDDPHLAYAKAVALFAPPIEVLSGIHETAVVHKTATVDPSAFIGPYAVVGAHVVIHQGAQIGAQCVIGERAVIGAMTRLYPNVTLYAVTQLGERVTIHSGAVVGSDGFGMAQSKSGWIKIPHLGSVIIGNDVEIGANTTIDRGVLDDTVIESNVKIDNLVQIAHNVLIGEGTVIAGCVGIAGSTQIGRRCMIGGASGIAGHVKLTDGVILAGMSMVTNSIDKPGIYASGTGLLQQSVWRRAVARFRQMGKR